VYYYYYYYHHNCFTALWILSGTTQVSLYQKGKAKDNLDFLKQVTDSVSGMNWAMYKSAPHPRQLTTPAPITGHRYLLIIYLIR